MAQQVPGLAPRAAHNMFWLVRTALTVAGLAGALKDPDQVLQNPPRLQARPRDEPEAGCGLFRRRELPFRKLHEFGRDLAGTFCQARDGRLTGRDLRSKLDEHHDRLRSVTEELVNRSYPKRELGSYQRALFSGHEFHLCVQELRQADSGDSPSRPGSYREAAARFNRARAELCTATAGLVRLNGW